MGGIDRDLHWPWLGFALEQAFERGLYEAKDVLVHATAEVLVSQLPHDVLIALFSRALAAETLAPRHVLETAPPSLLAEHLEPDVMWRCLREIADRAGLSQRGGSRTEVGRRWLSAILQGALETELLTPADVMRHLPPAEFVKDTPLPVMAELIKAGLLGGKFDPGLILQHLTPQVIGEHLETSLVWMCITEAVMHRFELGGGAPGREDQTGKIALAAAAKKNGNGNGKASKEARIEPVAPKRKPDNKVIDKADSKLESIGKGEPSGPFDVPKTEDWGTAEELDVVEEGPLPPPPVAVAKPRTT
jgi:hypothetical protein